MYYYETENKTGKRTGIIAGIIYILVWAVLFLLINIGFTEKELGQGIIMNFGDVESASGMADPGVNTVAVPRQQRPQTAPRPVPEQMQTQDVEEAPEVAVTAPRPNSQPAETAQTGENKPAQTTPEPVEQPRVANPKLNFPGRTEGSTSTSEGTGEGSGNQGAPHGIPEGSHEGAGEGAGGTGFDLAGRSVVGSLPSPTYGANKQGRVVIEITVDQGGVVVNAVYRARGSTTNDSELVNAALGAARRSRFSLIDSEGLQTGTITYNFRLK